MNGTGWMKRAGGWMALILGAAMLAGLGLEARAEEAGSAKPESAKPESAEHEPSQGAAAAAAAAWMPAEGRTAGQAMDALIDSANERFAKAREEKREGIEEELLTDFEGFAAAWAGTDEAILALIQSGMLARMADDFERAERNLNRAAELTDDPEFENEIRRELAAILIRPGMQAPDFALRTVDGREITLADFKGKVLLLDFWATWCSPCIAELPNLKAVYGKHHAEGFEVLSISLDSERDYFARFIAEQAMTWTHVYQDEQKESVPLADRYGVISIPRMILVGPDGRVLASQLRGEQLNEAVARAIAGEE